MTGRQKCRILKEIRAQIARENDIDLVIEECPHRGECRGTCPRCESEVAYLERELEKRRRARKRVALAGVSAGVTLALAGCSAVEDAVSEAWDRITGRGQTEIVELEGDVPCYDPAEVQGKMLLPETPEDGEAPQETGGAGDGE